MLDFVKIKEKRSNEGLVIYPDFIVKKADDLLIRGHSFYAIWDEEKGLWSQDEYDVQRMVDKMTLDYSENRGIEGSNVKLLSSSASNKWVEWQRYSKSLPDNYHELDSHITFSNSSFDKNEYITKSLSYAIGESSIESYDELMNTLYDPEERKKLEWAVGSIIKGDSKWIQKFIVIYGSPGSGKSTFLNIVEKLFEGYCSTFDSKALASATNAFSLEAFKNNPLIAIQHDGDLSKIEDNTKLNSIVSHENLIINEKHKSTYTSSFYSFLFMGTNKPVRITDSKSGIIRRLIDVYPSGRTIPFDRYKYLMDKIDYELGGIAYHCLQVYNSLGPSYYNNYIPVAMIGATNDMYNFIIDNYDLFVAEDSLQLSTAWLRYKEYCQDANVTYPYSKRAFKEELKTYYQDFYERYGTKRSVYVGFLKSKFEYDKKGDKESKNIEEDSFLIFKENNESFFDTLFKDCPAQYATSKETPYKPWCEVDTKLSDINTKKLHYVKLPDNVITIDFDIKDESGNKSFKKNLEEMKKFPKTYAELSKSGEGIHLHYFYDGDPNELARLISTDIEIKISKGDSSLRRKLTKNNGLDVSRISSGLPKKKRKSMVADNVVKDEKKLRALIIKNLRKEIHPNTKPSIDFIYKLLEDAYNSGMKYDVTDMRNDIQSLAFGSTHQAPLCLSLISKMHFKSDEPSPNIENCSDDTIVFYDVEVFPNLLVVVWKKKGPGSAYIKMINPTPSEVEELTKFKLVGFNNRKYDNHILYARMMGYSTMQLFELSQRIIVDQDKDAFFGQAYNLSYTDIYDFLSASNKMSLKKWEIKLGIHHQELGLRWDQPVPEELWAKVADYCCNDVFATEAVWDANQADWKARMILAELSGLTVNDTTNSHTTKIIVGDDPDPWSKYVYTDLSTIFPGYEYSPYGIDKSKYKEGAKIVKGKSLYMGEDPGEGGYAWGNPGMYINVALLDVASMHPHSAIRLNIFGDEYTMRFADIVGARLYIKHKMYDEAKLLLDGKLAKFLDDPEEAAALADALKTAINSVYGLTSANFKHKLKDPRNVDNIVAKYGALFMITLKNEVINRGYTVVHIKTDSIKIANADKDIIDFVVEFGKEYGFTFEHEATYSKMCIVNDAVYIAKYDKPHIDKKTGKEIWWTATGTQFQIPYVFKTLFSKEPILFGDLCETKSVSTAMYLDMNEELTLPFVFDDNGDLIPEDSEKRHDYHFIGKVGLFCPIKFGKGGGLLLRETGDKYTAVTGTKIPGRGDECYRWLEAETVKALGKEGDIDRSYYDHLVDEAVAEISKYGDFEWFTSDDHLNFVDIPDTLPDGEVPFDEYINAQNVA